MKKLFSPVLWMLAVCLTGGTASATQQTPVALGSASTFAILAGTTVTVTGGGSITGNIGISPGTAFVPDSVTVHGTVYAGGPVAAQAQADLTVAFNDAAGRQTPAIVAGNIGGQTLTPGLYKSTSSLAVSSGDLTLDAQGNPNAVFIFQIASTFDMTPGRQVILAGNAQAANIFWQVGSSATLDTTSVLHGNILAAVSITMNTGARLDGRALAQGGAVTLDTGGGNSATVTITRLLATITPGIISSVNLSGLGSVAAAGAALDSTSNLYVVDSPRNRIIKVDPSGVASLFTITGQTLAAPSGIAVDGSGNLDIVDSGNNRIIQVASNGAGTVIVPNGGLILSAPTGIAIAANGTIYVADTGNARIVEIPLPGTSSVLTPGATLVRPIGLTFDATGDLFIADAGSRSILKVVPAGTSSVFASGLTLSSPAGLSTDLAENVYLADSGLNKVFRISSAGVATLIAGTGASGDSGDGGVATSALLSAPTAIVVASDGTAYITDSQALRKISPNSVFANTNVGATTIQNLSVNNIGNLSYTFGSSLAFGHTPSEFSLVNTGAGDCSTFLSSSFPSAASCNLQIQFTPTVASTYTDTLTLAPGLQLLLTGIGVPAVVNPGGPANPLAVSPNALNFGNQLSGVSGAARTFTLHNNGANALNIGSFTKTGSNAGDFSLTSNCASTLASGATCTASVVFTPATIGIESASVVFADSDPIAGSAYSQTVALTGTGTAPVVTGPALPSSTSFGLTSQFSGGSGAAQTLTLTNTGSNALNLISWIVTGPNAADFTVTPMCGTTLSAAATCTVGIVFRPSVAGNEVASLTLTYTDAITGATYTQVIALTGAGLSGVPTGIVEILNRNSGKALDVVLVSTANGAPLQQYDYLGGANQKWQFIPDGNGYYKLVSINSGKVLDVTAASTVNGALIQQWQDLGTDNQKWAVTQLPDGSFNIANKLSGKLLDVIALSESNGALIQQWDSTGADNQQWNILVPAFFTVTNKLSGKVLDVTAVSNLSGALIQQWTSLGGANQQWQFVSLGNGYYQVLNRNSGKGLDATDPSDISAPNGTLVQQYSYLGRDNQQWRLIPTGNGYFEIANKAGGNVLDVTAYSLSNGAAIQLWTYLGGDNQQWRIDFVQ